LEIIYPLHCGGCGSKGEILCKHCVTSFKFVEDEMSCPLCGRWLGKKTVCGECIEKERGFQEGHYGFYFENRLRDAIHAFKFNGRIDVGRNLIRLLKNNILFFSESFDCIIPLPVTKKRLKERGFNQSFIISEEISAITNKTLHHSVLCKSKNTKDQYALHRDERKRNIKGVFTVKNSDKIKRKKALLVDDLFTTGYTAKEASGMLLKAGAESVIFFALARTPS
jgi:competence protein ComFC